MSTNRICELFGIEYPIIQAPMNWITGADLAAAVSNAGGLGTIGPNGGAREITTDVTETAERLRQQIRKTKDLTDKPFAVNFPIGIDERGRAFSRSCIDVALEEGIAVAIMSMGPPTVYTPELKNAGVKVMHAVSTPSQAAKAEKKGVDVVVCEGFEGGGHKATTGLTTMTMIPMTSDLVHIPIVAAGGIADARGVIASLALGADAVYMGTRFIASNECDAHPKAKQNVIGANDTATVTLNKWVVDGRNLENQFTRKYIEKRASGASMEEMMKMIGEAGMYKALVQGDTEEGELPCGQIAGMFDNQPSAADIVNRIINNISVVIDEIKQKI